MAKLTIVVNVHAAPGERDFIYGELADLVKRTRAEEGCLLFELHQNNSDSNHFLCFETWETKELWLAHTRSPHLVAYKAATAQVVEKRSLFEMTKIEVE